MVASLSKAARAALARLAAGKHHNASAASLSQLLSAGLVELGASGTPTITQKGRQRAASARERAVAHYHRTRHTGGTALPPNWVAGVKHK